MKQGPGVGDVSRKNSVQRLPHRRRKIGTSDHEFHLWKEWGNLLDQELCSLHIRCVAKVSHENDLNRMLWSSIRHRLKLFGIDADGNGPDVCRMGIRSEICRIFVGHGNESIEFIAA